MSIDEKKNSTGLFSDLIISKESVDNMCIEDYVLATLGVEKSAIENPEIFFKNYVHLMCHLCKDISTKDLLVLYDDHLYTKFNTSYIESNDEAEVEIINRYEMIHAERMVYSSNDENFKIITKEINILESFTFFNYLTSYNYHL